MCQYTYVHVKFDNILLQVLFFFGQEYTFYLKWISEVWGLNLNPYIQ